MKYFAMNQDYGSDREALVYGICPRCHENLEAKTHEDLLEILTLHFEAQHPEPFNGICSVCDEIIPSDVRYHSLRIEHPDGSIEMSYTHFTKDCPANPNFKNGPENDVEFYISQSSDDIYRVYNLGDEGVDEVYYQPTNDGST